MGNSHIGHATFEPGFAPNSDYDSILMRLRDEFLDYAGDALDELDALIDASRAPDNAAAQTINAIRRGGHNLKGMGGSFGFPLITQLAHCMEDYFIVPDCLDQRGLEGKGDGFADDLAEALARLGIT